MKTLEYDLITGEKFIKISDIVYCPVYDNLYCEYNVNLYSNIDIPIIYTHTFWIKELFNKIEKFENEILIITHNSDDSTPDIEIPKCVKKWYSQNVTIKNDKIESIPIGLENSIWFPELDKKNKIINKKYENKKYRNLLYINHNINTNFNERNEPYILFKNQKWTTVEKFSNGQNFENYINNIYNHKFVLCPNGNGIDTVRLWETLYLESIPIVKYSINTDFYKDLPILFVNNWNDITSEFLENEYDRINNTIWNLDKLKFEWWENKIKNERKN